MTERDPSKITQVGLGFWASKCLLSAVELGLFTELDTHECRDPYQIDRAN